MTPQLAHAIAPVLFIVDSIMIVWVWRSIFPTWDDFWSAIAYWIKPDWISLFQGDYMEDCYHEGKLGVALLLTGVLAFAPIYAWTF